MDGDKGTGKYLGRLGGGHMRQMDRECSGRHGQGDTGTGRDWGKQGQRGTWVYIQQTDRARNRWMLEQINRDRVCNRWTLG